MNGFFRLVSDGKGTQILLYPPEAGGQAVDLAEVSGYLTAHKIKYDLTEFYEEARELGDVPLLVNLNSDNIGPERESLSLSVSRDGMSATARFYAPGEGGRSMSAEDILEELAIKGISYGIIRENIDRFCSERLYCTDYEVAAGKPQKYGRDAYVRYYFSTDARPLPTLRPDGSVDFFNLNIVHMVGEGDLLCELIPAVPSEEGYSIYGEKISCTEVKTASIKYGKNCRISEDNTRLYAEKSGNVTYTDGLVSVDDFLEVNNIDTSTGNLEFKGSIHITGNICENFSVKCDGNVVVDGSVEGAVIEAGGDVVIARGMSGMGKGRIVAGGNIIAKFFESANISAGGYIQSDSIIYSEVKAGDVVRVGGRRGFISGGHVVASNGIEVKNLGSSMSRDTVIEVGIDPAIKDRINRLRNTIVEGSKALEASKPILTSATARLKNGEKLSADQISYIKKLTADFAEKQKAVEKAQAELIGIQQQVLQQKNACVKVEGTVWQGTIIKIGDLSYTVRTDFNFCRFAVEQGEIRMSALE